MVEGDVCAVPYSVSAPSKQVSRKRTTFPRPCNSWCPKPAIGAVGQIRNKIWLVPPQVRPRLLGGEIEQDRCLVLLIAALAPFTKPQRQRASSQVAELGNRRRSRCVEAGALRPDPQPLAAASHARRRKQAHDSSRNR